MQWIHSISLKQIKGPTLYTAIVSGLVMVAVNGLGWHLNAQTVLGFFAIVASFIWNNGKFGFKAVHKVNFFVTVISGVLLVLNKGLGWNVPMQYVDGAVALVIGVLFHNANATAIIKQLNAANPVSAVAPAAPTGK